jgi:hypothetical protein
MSQSQKGATPQHALPESTEWQTPSEFAESTEQAIVQHVREQLIEAVKPHLKATVIRERHPYGSTTAVEELVDVVLTCNLFAIEVETDLLPVDVVVQVSHERIDLIRVEFVLSSLVSPISRTLHEILNVAPREAIYVAKLV